MRLPRTMTPENAEANNETSGDSLPNKKYVIAMPARRRSEKEPPPQQHLLKGGAAVKEADPQKGHHE